MQTTFAISYDHSCDESKGAIRSITSPDGLNTRSRDSDCYSQLFRLRVLLFTEQADTIEPLN